jgi:uncharacterized protein (UPF0548 family)
MYRLQRPSVEQLTRLFPRLQSAPLTYPEVGGTRGHLPAGYDHLRRRVRLGHGDAVFADAAAEVRGWNLHRRTGLLVAASTPHAEADTVVVVGLKLTVVWVLVPCRVVWSVEQSDRAGFAYGTLPGHHERGEEAFVVERDEQDAVWLTITAFSRPASWIARLLAPVARRQQQRVTDAYLRALQPP